MAQEHEQVVRQEEQIDHFKCPYCGGTFNSHRELREHSCVINNTEPVMQPVQSNR